MEYNDILTGNYEGNIHISIDNGKYPREYEWDVTEEIFKERIKELEEDIVLKAHKEMTKTLELQARELFPQGEGNGR